MGNRSLSKRDVELLERGRVAGMRADYAELSIGQRVEQAIRLSHELTKLASQRIPGRVDD